MHVGDDRRDDSTSNPSARYTDEFRRETADYIISTGRPITQCRSELGLNSNTVRKWSRTAAASLRASPIREVLSARQVLGPHSVQGARAGDTRPHAQRREAHTIPDPKARRRPDLVRHDFNSPVPTYKLVGDITHLRTREGRLYLSTVIDPDTHMVVGRSLSARFDGRHRGIGAGVGKIARLRGRRRQNRAATWPATPYSTPTAAPSTPAGFCPSGRATTTCACPAAAPATATTTRWRNRSSRR